MEHGRAGDGRDETSVDRAAERSVKKCRRTGEDNRVRYLSAKISKLALTNNNSLEYF